MCTRPYRQGIAAISGLAASVELPTTVHPFILRGITLAGIDSVRLPIDKRRKVWRQLPIELTAPHLGLLTSNISVLEVPDALRQIIGGGITGRTRVIVKDGF